MDSYISGELIAKLREEQRYLRRTLEALEHTVKQTNMDWLLSQFHQFTSLYQSHASLVGALLEAVEPDDPRSPPHDLTG